jgi:hypothetical protein
LSRILEAAQVTPSGHGGHRNRELDAPQRLERLDHWRQAPGIHVLWQFLLPTRQMFGLFIERANVFLETDLRRGCGTDHVREPLEMGGAPGGPARITAIEPLWTSNPT